MGIFSGLCHSLKLISIALGRTKLWREPWEARLSLELIFPLALELRVDVSRVGAAAWGDAHGKLGFDVETAIKTGSDEV